MVLDHFTTAANTQLRQQARVNLNRTIPYDNLLDDISTLNSGAHLSGHVLVRQWHPLERAPA